MSLLLDMKIMLVDAPMALIIDSVIEASHNSRFVVEILNDLYRVYFSSQLVVNLL